MAICIIGLGGWTPLDELIWHRIWQLTIQVQKSFRSGRKIPVISWLAATCSGVCPAESTAFACAFSSSRQRAFSVRPMRAAMWSGVELRIWRLCPGLFMSTFPPHWIRSLRISELFLPDSENDNEALSIFYVHVVMYTSEYPNPSQIYICYLQTGKLRIRGKRQNIYLGVFRGILQVQTPT